MYTVHTILHGADINELYNARMGAFGRHHTSEHTFTPELRIHICEVRFGSLMLMAS